MLASENPNQYPNPNPNQNNDSTKEVGQNNDSSKEEGPKDPFLDFFWPSTNTESELELLVLLKELVIVQTKNADTQDVAKVFDANMLRGLGSVLVAYVKERIRRVSSDSTVGYKPSDEFQLMMSEQTRNLKPAARGTNISSEKSSKRKRKRQLVD